MKSEKIRIAFDYQIMVRQRFGGISKAFYETNKRIKSDDRFEISYPILLSQNYYFEDIIPVSKSISKSPILNYLARLINKVYFIRSLLCKNSYDIIHATYY